MAAAIATARFTLMLICAPRSSSLTDQVPGPRCKTVLGLVGTPIPAQIRTSPPSTTSPVAPWETARS